MNRIVLLSDGGPESLVASLLLLEDQRSRNTSLSRFALGCQIDHSVKPPHLHSSRRDCIEAHSNLIDSQGLEFMPEGCSLLLILARAVELAGPDGGIYWPVRCGDDLDFMKRTMETSLDLVRTNTTINGHAGPELMLPLLDLDHIQDAELAGELDAPIQSGWPCRSSSVTACGHCLSCQAWESALTATGVIPGSA